ncbi:RimJ/RimL family protein N-acetyltransferase [Scopulibacillus darangshiensis]|uniref:RimJ/RimL family protein N-acetyltransferase n=1 Tax=Scopulibacillus darangshiensis TaxID=442528 RepID=A0A4R2P6P8_9BACL|nr:GNAT family protein [Scopulibacillus darangshiensis]TCP29908.1 RimJ/RimL family protein N-acetyltransferase [Scopulibacillus darangshiensis]
MIKEYSEKFLKGKDIVLKEITAEYYEDFFLIENVSESRLLMNDDTPYPPTKSDLEKFLNGMSSDHDGYLFGIYRKEENKLIGSIGVSSVNWKNSTCDVGISLGPDFQGKGYGTDAMKTLITFIFNYLNINKIKLNVFGFNQRAIRSYEKCGFKTEGILREELFRFGKFNDIYAMGLLRSEWIQS